MLFIFKAEKMIVKSADTLMEGVSKMLTAAEAVCVKVFQFHYTSMCFCTADISFDTAMLAVSHKVLPAGSLKALLSYRIMLSGRKLGEPHDVWWIISTHC